MSERPAAGSPIPDVLEPHDRQLSLIERRAFHVAALGSVFLHAALLWLPLGSAHLGRDVSSPMQTAIRAVLRSAEPEPPRPVEPVPAPEPPLPRSDLKPAPAPEPRPEPKPPANPGTARESASVAAIPARFFDPASLSEKPKPLREPRLDLLTPILARAGVVHLILYISETGEVEEVAIDSATLPPAAAQKAAEIFGAVPFSPGRIDGTAVRTRVRITVGAEDRSKD